MRRPRQPRRSALPIVDRIRAANPRRRKPSGRSARSYRPYERFASRARAWKFGDPSDAHAPWCNVQPPLPAAGGCSCWRSITARTVRRIAERLVT